MAIQERSGRPKPYRVYWNNPLSQKRESLSFAKESDAVQFNELIKYKLKYDLDWFRPTVEVKEPSAMTFDSLLWDYLKAKQFKERNLRDCISHMKSVLPLIGDIPIADLTKRQMKDVETFLRNKGLKQNTIKRKMGIIIAAINWAWDLELIEVNPISRYRCAPGVDKKIPPPSPAEAEAIIAVAPEHIRRVVILGFYLGARIGPSELFRTKWEDIDLQSGRVRIWSADKNPETPWRDMVLRKELLPELASWRDKDKNINAVNVINYHGKPVVNIRKAWASALKAAKITRYFRPYDLRHAFATEALANGADPKAVAEIMGLSSTAMIYKHYQHVLNRQREAALAALPTLKLGHISGHIKTPD